MKKRNGLLAALLASTMVLGSLVGCSNTEVNEKNPSTTGSQEKVESDEAEVIAEITYPLEGNKTLSVATMGVTLGGDYKEFFETFQKATGVTLEYEALSFDAMNLMFASGDLPDIVVTYSNVFANGVNSAIEEEWIVPIDEYMDKWAPDLKATLESNDLFRKSATLDGYGVVGAPSLQENAYQATSAGMMLRADWLEKVGMDLPETADDLYNVLKAFKEECGAEAPLSVSLGWLQNLMNDGMITSPFGLARTNLYQVDGKVHYGYAEPEYKGVLEYLNKLYEEKLLDPNFQTLDGATQNANFMNGVSGVTANSAGGGIGTFLTTMEETNPEWDVAGISSLVAKKGDTAMMHRLGNLAGGVFMYITPACEDIETAMKFINYGYTEEGRTLIAFGEEGVAHTVVDGKEIYTELITKNPDGLTMAEALKHYTGALSSWGFVQEDGYWEQYAGRPQQQQAIKAWSKSEGYKYLLPPVEVLAEETDENATLSADIKTYVAEMLVKYVTGEKSLDTFESEYLATLEKMGVDRYIEIQQHALDAFNAR